MLFCELFVPQFQLENLRNKINENQVFRPALFWEVIVNSEEVRCGFATDYKTMLRIDLLPLLCNKTSRELHGLLFFIDILHNVFNISF